jgi:hypothetical protein
MQLSGAGEKLMKYQKKKLKAIDLLRKEHFIYRAYTNSELDVLSFFCIDYRIEGDLFLVKQSKAFEFHFKENLSMGSFKYYVHRANYLCDLNITMCIVSEKTDILPSSLCNKIKVLGIDALLSSLEKKENLSIF